MDFSGFSRTMLILISLDKILESDRAEIRNLMSNFTCQYENVGRVEIII